MRTATTAFLALAFAAGGCDGSESGNISSPPPTGSTPTPSPTPSPTPAPTPSPTPTATAAFPLAPRNTREFETGFASVAYTGTLTSNFAFGPATLFASSSASRISLTVPASSSTFVAEGWLVSDVNPGFTCDASRTTFAEPISNITDLPTSADREFTRLERLSLQDSLTLVNTLFEGRVTSDPAYQFRFVNYVRWKRDCVSNSARNRTDLLVFGAETDPLNLPASGVQTYAAILRGFDVSQGQAGAAAVIQQSTLTVRIDYAAKTVGFSFTLPERAGTADVDVAFSGTGALDAVTNRITGTLASSDGKMTGSISGRLFGPQAAEIGFAASVTGTVGSGSTLTEHRSAIAVIGK